VSHASLTRRRISRLGPDAPTVRLPRLRAPTRARDALAAADLAVDPDDGWTAWLAGTLWAVVAGGVLGGLVLAGVAAVSAVVVPLVVLAVRSGRADERLEAELPPLLDDVARALRSGGSLHQALTEAASGPGDARAQLAGALQAISGGQSFNAALDRWLAARPVPGVRLTVAALGLASETGGGAARAIDGVAATLRDREAVARELRALTSQARLSASVISIAPVAFAVMAVGVDGSTATFLFRTPIGGVCLLVGLALDAAGMVWMARLTRMAT
jgi:tight adherence protein B